MIYNTDGSKLRMHPEIKGFSITIAVGRFFTPHISKSQFSIRVCLGWLSITIWLLDIDETIKSLIDKNHK